MDNLLKKFELIKKLDYERILALDFDQFEDNNLDYNNVYLTIANLSDSKTLLNVFLNHFGDEHAYNKLEILNNIEDRINKPEFIYFLIKINKFTNAGYIQINLDLNKRRACFYEFALKKEVKSKINLPKIIMGCFFYIFKRYGNQILFWYSEVPFNDLFISKQMSIFSFKPVALLPNKTISFKKILSNKLIITYDSKVLAQFRLQKAPIIIRQVLDSYTFINRHFHLGIPIVQNPENFLDNNLIELIIENVYIEEEKIKNGLKTINIRIKNSNSAYKLLYNPFFKKAEEVDSFIESTEELFVFIQELKKIIERYNIKFLQCFSSAYKPEHQKIYLDSGFKPCGYLPSWNYNLETKKFEDKIIFCQYEGIIDINQELEPETLELCKELKFLPLTKQYVKRELSTRIMEDSNEILRFIQMGTNLPIFQEINKFLLFDLIYYHAKTILLVEDGNIAGQTLIYSTDNNVLYFGYFKVLNDSETKIRFLVDKLIEYAKINQYKEIRGPINIPAIIFGWGFMSEGSFESLRIGKPVNPPIYQNIFYENGFYLKNEIHTWEGVMPRLSPLMLKNYDFNDYEYFYPENYDDFLNYKSVFLNLHSENLPISAQYTPDLEGVFDNYVKFIFEFGFNFMLFFVKYKPENRIVACGSCLPNPFRKNKKNQNDSVELYSWAVDKNHRRKGLTLFMFCSSALLFWKNKIRHVSGSISNKNFANTGVAVKLGAKKTRTHLILEYKFISS